MARTTNPAARPGAARAGDAGGGEHDAAGRLRVGVSACLLGRPVRYDGGHKRDPFVTDLLGPFVDYVPVCPELEAGLGVPRLPIQLARRRGDGGALRVVEVKSGEDHTARMTAYVEARVRELAREDLDGFILKKGSPSCGLVRVPVHGEEGGSPSRDGRGLFAAALTARFPLLPVEEEARLSAPELRESFIVRLFAYRRLRTLFCGRWSLRELVRFHAEEKLLLLSHDAAACRELGRLVASARSLPRAELSARYQALYMRALARRATPRKHVNALQHMAGYLRRLIDAGDRTELAAAIEAHGQGRVPLIVPLTLIRHHARRHGVAYLLCQRYLSPHPSELLLRNHA